VASLMAWALGVFVADRDSDGLVEIWRMSKKKIAEGVAEIAWFARRWRRFGRR